MPYPEVMSNTTPLQGKRALIIGASAGIGAATARALDSAGASLILVARRKERLDQLAAELRDARAVPLDVKSPDAVQAALGGLTPDILVLNAGLAHGTSPAFLNTVDEVDDMIDTNIKGYLHILRAMLPAMKSRGSGDILMLGSVASRQVYPGGGVYCMTKHAVRALYESLRIDAAGHGLRFSTIDPGMVETDFSLVRFGGDEAKAKAVYEGLDALHANDIADAILYIVTRPSHVNIGEMVIWPTDQASTTIVNRR
jgi:3-hydroxy acid dehydrogenase / malonic semialdehyde reductase